MEAWKQAFLKDKIEYTHLNLPNGETVISWMKRFRVTMPQDVMDENQIIDALREISNFIVDEQRKIIRAVIAITEAKEATELEKIYEAESTHLMAEEARCR